MINRTYISTLCFAGTPISEIVRKAEIDNFNLEFSSGLPYDPNNIEFFNNFKNNLKLLHNYFPAPKVPFVINLASENKKIRELSIDHSLKNIELSAKNNIKFYAAHAGFCIDPEPDKLGKFIQIAKKFKRSEHIDIFVHDTHREIEIQYCDYFLRPNFEFVEEVTDPPGSRWEGRKLFYFRK